MSVLEAISVLKKMRDAYTTGVIPSITHENIEAALTTILLLIDRTPSLCPGPSGVNLSEPINDVRNQDWD